jgi:hypothetical protein
MHRFDANRVNKHNTAMWKVVPPGGPCDISTVPCDHGLCKAAALLLAGALLVCCGDGSDGPRTTPTPTPSPTPTVSASQFTGTYDVALNGTADSRTIGTARRSPTGELSIRIFLGPFDSISAGGQLEVDGTVHLEGFTTREDEVFSVIGGATTAINGGVQRIVGSIDQTETIAGQTTVVPGSRTTFAMERPTTASADGVSGHYLFAFPRSGFCVCASTAIADLTVAADGIGSTAPTIEVDASGRTIATLDAGSLVISPHGVFSLTAFYTSVLSDFGTQIGLMGELQTDTEMSIAGRVVFEDRPGPPPPLGGEWTAVRVAGMP